MPPSVVAQAALRAESSLATFLQEANMWPEDEQTVRAALNVVRRYTSMRG